MNVILTYDHPHRKTQDILFMVAAHGLKVKVISIAWKERKRWIPIVKHRPDAMINIPLYEICDNLGIEYKYSEDLFKDLSDVSPKNVFIAGSGILNKKITDKFDIINVHPAYLPYNRGLDALKWAVFNGTPLGVTAHYINEDIDSGKLIRQEFVNICYEDSFYCFADRVYWKEIKMLLEMIKENPSVEKYEDIIDRGLSVNRRMPHNLEIKMLQRFENIRKTL